MLRDKRNVTNDSYDTEIMDEKRLASLKAILNRYLMYSFIVVLSQCFIVLSVLFFYSHSIPNYHLIMSVIFNTSELEIFL